MSEGFTQPPAEPTLEELQQQLTKAVEASNRSFHTATVEPYATPEGRARAAQVGIFAEKRIKRLTAEIDRLEEKGGKALVSKELVTKSAGELLDLLDDLDNR